METDTTGGTPDPSDLSFQWAKDGGQWHGKDGSESEPPRNSFVGTRMTSIWRQVQSRRRMNLPGDSCEEERVPYDRLNRRRSIDALDNLTLIVAATQDNLLFQNMPLQQIERLVEEMIDVECETGRTVISQGEEGNYFYVVHSGTYHASKVDEAGDNCHLGNTYTAGGCFGELALMYNCTRAATITCDNAGKLWAIDRQTFADVLMQEKKAEMDTVANFLKSVPMTSKLSAEEQDTLAHSIEMEVHDAGAVVLRQEDHLTGFYLVKEGEVAVHVQSKHRLGSFVEFTAISNHREVEMSPGRAPSPGTSSARAFLDAIGPEKLRVRQGGTFGDAALLEDVSPVSVSTIVSITPTTLLKVPLHEAKLLLGTNKASLALSREVLATMKCFAPLTLVEREALLFSLEQRQFPEGADIVRQGDDADCFYIISAGHARVSAVQTGSNEMVAIKEQLGPGDYFGESGLLNESARGATVTATTELSCHALNRGDFTRLLGPMKSILQRAANERQREVDKATRAPIQIGQLITKQTLGVGSFGRVKLVEDKASGKLFALKCLSKKTMVETKQVVHARHERELLSRCNHPFIVELITTSQDPYNLYMLLELIPGGELFTLLVRKQRFPEPITRFYAACVTSALTYLHDREIMYRDLKPENVLLDAKGYIKLVDFGFAKHSPIGEYAFTMCGTPEYMPPELIRRKGYMHAADWWSLGILIYEMIVGQSPFAAAGKSADGMLGIVKKIIAVDKKPVRLPEQIAAASSEEAQKILSCLLVSDPLLRLGSRCTRDVRSHPFFTPHVDFTRLEQQTLKGVPFVPKLSGPADMRNFEPCTDEAPRPAGLEPDPQWETLFSDWA